MQLFLPCPLYLEHLLVDEASRIGAKQAVARRAGVSCVADLETAYRLVLWSRLASRVLLHLESFECPDSDALYTNVARIEWPEIFSSQKTFAIRASGGHGNLDNTQFIAQRTKDAIVDGFRSAGLNRPDVDTRQPDVVITVHVTRDSASLSLDLGGHSLHQRGYRVAGAAAPLKENLAAALLYRADWPALSKLDFGLADPFCGAGTLVIEAAMMAADMAPSLLQNHFALEHLTDHDGPLWHQLRQETRERARAGRQSLQAKFTGSDTSATALNAARKAGHTLGLDPSLTWKQQAYHSTRPQHMEGLLITNPPWGERLNEEMGLVGLYHHLGQHLRDYFGDWHGALLTGSETLGRATGLQADSDYKFRHGPLDCQLLLFGRLSDQPPARSEGINMLGNRLDKNTRRLSPLLNGQDTSCYRLYDADLPEFNAAIDVYEDHLHIQEYQAPDDIPNNTTERRLRELVTAAILHHGTSPDQVHVKVRARQSGADQYRRQNDSENSFHVVESDLKFEVNLDDYLDTGLFLDHRKTRAMVRQLADSKDVLNLFSYTGSVSVYAAKGGAKSVTSVDMSRTYMNWARTNFRINHLTLDNYEFVQADVLQWLQDNTQKFDLIFLDPPTFSNSKRMESTLDIQRDHAELIDNTLQHLKPGGILLFSTNAGSFKMEFERDGWWVNEITRKTLPLDFHNAKTHHRAWQIEKAH